MLERWKTSTYVLFLSLRVDLWLHTGAPLIMRHSFKSQGDIIVLGRKRGFLDTRFHPFVLYWRLIEDFYNELRASFCEIVDLLIQDLIERGS